MNTLVPHPEVSLAPYTTLRAGGRAEQFARARTTEDLVAVYELADRHGWKLTIVGGGSNILPADAGVRGLVVLNETSGLRIFEDGLVEVDSGVGFQELFLRTAQAGLGGLEYAVGIPGSVGGALVSNAGAYRSNISEFLTEIEIVHDGDRKWVGPDWMEFSYRDSRLRRDLDAQCILLCMRFRLAPRDKKAIYDEAREYQRQRISKQPPPASAGSFFKNVNDATLAASLDTLPGRLRTAGVVPAGYLIEKAGLMGYRKGRAMFARKHANFIVNIGAASAMDIRDLARVGKKAVLERYGVELEEEVLYLGEWPD